MSPIDPVLAPEVIAAMDGTIRIGLEDAALDALGQLDGVMKLSRADLGFAIALGRTGSTTVAATMILAQLAGIEVFATGGIGGVHRGADQSFDISADLQELAQTRVRFEQERRWASTVGNLSQTRSL